MTRSRSTHRTAPALSAGALGVLLALTATPANAFDFETGNAPIEVIIPAAVPVVYASASAPGDATLILRFTTLLTNAWFDATAPYHPTAVGVYSRLGRRPASESADNTNLNVAIFHASYHTLVSLFPQHTADWQDMLYAVGLDPLDDHESTDDPVGIGNAAAKAMLAVREHDGMNQLGYDGGRTYNPRPYADSTGYVPVNTPYELKDPSRWQPALNFSPYGAGRVQHFITPQYAEVLPYSYADPSVFSVPPPVKSNPKGKHGITKYREQADEVLAASAALTDEQKMMAELFDDKIRSLGFSALFMTLSRGMSLLEFVQYDFLTNLAAFDVGIAVWQEKRKYDAVRPFTAIKYLYKDQPVTAWGGPGQGTVTDLPASEWRSYLNVADHPEYPSGSASFCGAHAQASRLFFGSDDFGWQIPVPAGSSLVEPGVTPQQDIVLQWDTWTEFAEDCGMSRYWSGVHFIDAVVNSQPLATEIGTLAYDFFKAHVDGTAP